MVAAGDIDSRTEKQKGKLSLHRGYAITTGIKGSKLSGGQKQRIAIARAVIRKPQILLLDEATSALDEKSQDVVQRALEKCMQDRTSVVVAHRLTTVEKCDRIVVIDQGRVVEEGKPEELKSREDGFF